MSAGGPAFPSKWVNDSDMNAIAPNGQVVFPGGVIEMEGMTLRDYFAAHAPDAPERWHGGDRGVDDIIAWRWHYADAMLKARKA